jgi:hypothetical protein
MTKQLSHRNKLTVTLLVSAAATVCLVGGIERARAFRGGFHGGSFGGGTSRFGDGGRFDRSTDAGFGRGGYGSIHSASSFSNHADTFRQSHPEYQHDAGQFEQSHPNTAQNARQLQQNRTNEANTLQPNRYNDANSLRSNRINTYNNYSGGWSGYYSGLGFGAGMAIGATLAVLPATAAALSVAGNPYYYAVASTTRHNQVEATQSSHRRRERWSTHRRPPVRPYIPAPRNIWIVVERTILKCRKVIRSFHHRLAQQ